MITLNLPDRPTLRELAAYFRMTKKGFRNNPEYSKLKFTKGPRGTMFFYKEDVEQFLNQLNPSS